MIKYYISIVFLVVLTHISQRAEWWICISAVVFAAAANVELTDRVLRGCNTPGKMEKTAREWVVFSISQVAEAVLFVGILAYVTMRPHDPMGRSLAKIHPILPLMAVWGVGLVSSWVARIGLVMVEAYQQKKEEEQKEEQEQEQE